MDNKAIADQIAGYKAAYVYATTGGVMLSGHPQRGQMLKSWSLPSDGNIELHRVGRSNYSIPLEDYFSEDEGEPTTTLTILSAMPTLMVIEAASLIKYEKTRPWPPEFELLRHVRNAIAHNGLVHFKHSFGPAEFEGIRISEEDNGRPLKEILGYGDMLALLDSVVEILRELPETL